MASQSLSVPVTNDILYVMLDESGVNRFGGYKRIII